MGVVFAAREVVSGKRIAVKRLLPGAPAQVVALFQREFHVLASIRHPRIIQVYDYGTDVEGSYYTMELLEGSDLRDLAPLDVRTACQYLSDVASSLALLHARRLLHRDVSPRNVRTTEDGRCKLIDFGALSAFGVADAITGTPPGIAPECVFGHALDQRADLFSLGALAYWLLTGRHAFPARRVSDLADAWVHRPLPPSAHASGVPNELDELVLALLSFDVLARPASAGEVIERLRAIGKLEPEGDAQTAQAYLAATACVERAAELQRMRRRIDQLKGGRGGAVLIESSRGLGKTRLLAEAALDAQLAEVCVLRADGAQHPEPFGTAHALLLQLARLARGVALRVLGPHTESIAAVWPGLVQELELPCSHAASGERERARVLRELPDLLASCLRTAAGKTLLCVAVDNLHAADAESAALLLNLARTARDERLALLFSVTLSPDSEPPVLRAMRDACRVLRLRELSEAGVSELVRSTFGDVPYVQRTARRLFEATRGNPQDCLTVLQDWVSEGVVRYVRGTWILPLELHKSARVSVDAVFDKRIATCSDAARDLLDVLSVWARPASLLQCSELLEAALDDRLVLDTLHELLANELLAQVAGVYAFSHEGFRAARVASFSEQRRAALHARCARVLDAASATDVQTAIRAGEHWILAGRAAHGAEAIARAARSVLADPREPVHVLIPLVSCLESALDVYRREARGNLELLDLLVPLVACSYDVSYAFSMRYGGETVRRLERALGLAVSEQSSFDCTPDELYRRLGSAPALESGELKPPHAPDVVALVGWLIRCVMTLSGAASAAIDHETQWRLERALRPFRAFGEDHPASVAHEYSRLMAMMTEDHLQAAHAGWSALLERLDRLPLPVGMARHIRIGALVSLGVLESQRDDDAVLVRLEQLEALRYAQRSAAVNQLRFLYHGFRGEVDLAEMYRARVEEYAMARGAAWQVEIWSTSTLTAVYGMTGDATRHQRVVQELDRLKNEIPCLELFWQRALGVQCLVTDDPAGAVRLLEISLQRPGARDRVGWGSVQGARARAYNQLGQHAEALAVCDEAVAASEQDREFVAMNLMVRLERCDAYAGLGRFAEARAELDVLFTRHASRKNPLTVGCLHRSFARVALLEKDWSGFEKHVAAMEDAFRVTENPALIAQSAKLRHASGRHATPAPATTGVAAERSSHSLWRSLFTECHGSYQRRQRALEIVADRVGAKQAWLLSLNAAAEPLLQAQLGSLPAPSELLQESAALVREFLQPAEETHFIDANASEPPPARAGAFRLLALTLQRGAAAYIAGVIAVPASAAGYLEPAALQELALELSGAGDVGTLHELA
jgi:tetratricopeptide (TPR) repeat protein